MTREAEPGGTRPQAREHGQPRCWTREGRIFPWSLQKEPSLLSPCLQPCKTHFGLVAFGTLIREYISVVGGFVCDFLSRVDTPCYISFRSATYDSTSLYVMLRSP